MLFNSKRWVTKWVLVGLMLVKYSKASGKRRGEKVWGVVSDHLNRHMIWGDSCQVCPLKSSVVRTYRWLFLFDLLWFIKSIAILLNDVSINFWSRILICHKILSVTRNQCRNRYILLLCIIIKKDVSQNYVKLYSVYILRELVTANPNKSPFWSGKNGGCLLLLETSACCLIYPSFICPKCSAFPVGADVCEWSSTLSNTRTHTLTWYIFN